MRPAQLTAIDALRARVAAATVTPDVFRAALSAVADADRDAWMDRVWGTDEIPDDDPGLPRGCVPYLPCPVATVLEALDLAGVTSTDVFVDVGAGLGRALALTYLVTGATCIGIEIQPGLARAARARAADLNLPRLQMIEDDAANLVRLAPAGSVFFLYCPFSGPRLRRVLADLEAIAGERRIRVCCVDLAPLDCSWLTPVAPARAGLSVYASRPPEQPRERPENPR